LTVSIPHLAKFKYLKASINIFKLEVDNKNKAINGKVESLYISFASDIAFSTTLFDV